MSTGKWLRFAAVVMIGFGLLPASLAGDMGEAGTGEDAHSQAEEQALAPLRVEVSPARRVQRGGAGFEPSGRDAGDPALLADFVTVNVAPEGDGPTDLTFSADGSIIVIAHRDSHNLVVFDADTRTVLQTIPLSGSPNAVALSSDGTHAVTANLFEDNASIVDLVAGSEVATVATGDQPGVVSITPDGSTAVVGNTLDSSLSVIDIATATEVREIAGANFAQITSFGTFAATVSFTGYVTAPDNTTLIFPDKFNDQIVFFDISAGTSNPVASEPGPAVVALSPDGAAAVVSHDSPLSAVTVVAVPGQTISKHIVTGGAATMMPPIAINPDKTRAVVAVSNAVRVVDLVTDLVSGDLSTGSVKSLGTTADGLYCVVGNYLGSLVSFTSQTIVANLLTTTTPDSLAVSPAGPRAATAHILRKEFMEVMNVDGASGYLEGVVPTGPAPEGDKARDVAVSSDGSTAVVINNHSHNATVIDLRRRAIVGVAPVGERPGGVAITPDGSVAVVANLDSTFASVIDLSNVTVTNIGISRRGSTVAIAPDGSHAYVAVVADGDGVWRLDLDSLTVDGPKLLTGNMGTIGFPFDRASGMTLSHDGATLVTCGSFTDNVSIIDTASWAVVANVPVGSFPVRAVFSPDDSAVYVSNRDGSSVGVVENSGASSSLVDTVYVGATPFELAVHPSGSTLYVGNYDGRSISVVALPANVVTATIPIPQTGGAGEPVGLHATADGVHLYVTANGADVHLIDTATLAIVDTLNTGRAPTMLAFSDAAERALIPSPYGGDGLSIVTLWQEIFADGFESGNTSAWSMTIP